METEFIYWRHGTPAGIVVEEISGGEDKSPAVWKAMALQVFGENGKDRFRIIGHYPNGAPYLEDEQQRISISHTSRFLCVAELPRTPEADLEKFGLRTALGIDCERCDREQTVKVRERVLSERELEMIDKEDIIGNVLLWTCKEALYKAALTPGLDFATQLEIIRPPVICEHPGPLNKENPSPLGEGRIHFPDGKTVTMDLYSYKSEGHVVTLAYSPKCAKFKK